MDLERRQWSACPLIGKTTYTDLVSCSQSSWQQFLVVLHRRLIALALCLRVARPLRVSLNFTPDKGGIEFSESSML